MFTLWCAVVRVSTGMKITIKGTKLLTQLHLDFLSRCFETPDFATLSISDIRDSRTFPVGSKFDFSTLNIQETKEKNDLIIHVLR